MVEARGGGTRTLDKAIDLLVELGAHPDGASNLALSRAVGIDKSTTHRLLTTLARRGIVRRDPRTKRFRIGPHLLEIASGATVGPPLVARSILQRLVALTNESAFLSVLCDLSFVPIESVEAPREIRFAPEVGKAYPLNAGATGKAILAFDDHLRERVLSAGELRALTPRSFVSAKDFAAELDRVAAAGYATSEGERVVGACAIAAPLRAGSGGRVLGALTVSSVAARCDLDCLTRYVPELQALAEELSEHLEHPLPVAA